MKDVQTNEKKIKNVNALILKTYWKLMKHANVCTIGGFQCLLINVNYSDIEKYIVYFIPKNSRKTFTTNFGRWWCLYRNCLVDFVIYYHSEVPVDIDAYSKRNIVSDNDLQSQIVQYDKLKFVVVEMSEYTRATQLTKYFPIELNVDVMCDEYIELSTFTLNHSSDQFITPDKKCIIPFESISTGSEAAEYYKRHIDGVICGNFTSDGEELNNIYYLYNNEYIWWYLNKLIRERNGRDDIDSFLKVGYTFPKRNRHNPICNRGIGDMGIVDILNIGFGINGLSLQHHPEDIVIVYPRPKSIIVEKIYTDNDNREIL